MAEKRFADERRRVAPDDVETLVPCPLCELGMVQAKKRSEWMTKYPELRERAEEDS